MIGTPLIPTAYWGPSIHFKPRFLSSYCGSLLNPFARDKYWNQEGVYISYNDDLSNPYCWMSPDRSAPSTRREWPILQIVGIEKGGTDKLARAIGTAVSCLGQSTLADSRFA